jgi:hypothetical protein
VKSRNVRKLKIWHLARVGEKVRGVAEGNPAQPFDWLERAYAERDGPLVWLKVHPRLDSIRDEPRFRDLLAQ